MSDVTRIGPRGPRAKKLREQAEKITQYEREHMLSNYIEGNDRNPSSFAPLKKFVTMSPNGIEKLVYEVTKGGEVIPSELSAVENMVSESMKVYFHGNPVLEMTTQQISQCCKFWLKSSIPIERPKMISWAGEDCLSFRKLPFEVGVGDTPLFDELMSRITNSQALMAFIGSLLVEDSYLQQYVWIHGNGKDGKGSLCRFLDKVLGSLAIAKRPPAKDDQFWMYELSGKRLTIFADCANTKFVTSGFFKSLTGGDAQNIVKKFGGSWKEFLKTKFMFTSNEKPSVTSEESDNRRIIYCEVSPPCKSALDNHDYERQLWDNEARFFVTKCLIAYQEMCPTHGPIKSDHSLISEQMEFVEEPYEVFFEKNFMFKEGEKMPASDYYLTLKDGFPNPKHQAEMRDWLFRKHGIKKCWERNGNKVFKFYPGLVKLYPSCKGAAPNLSTDNSKFHDSSSSFP